MIRLIPILLSLVFLASGVSAAETVNKNYGKKEFGPVVNLMSGVFGHLQVPVDSLKDAKIIPGSGLIVSFPDRSYFSMNVLTSEEAGYEGVDIRSWPLYLFGIKKTGDEPESYIDDLLKSKEYVIDESIAPKEIRVFDSVVGTGYWAVGKSSSFIVLTSEEYSDQIAVIKTDGMSESSIRKLIINGVI